MIVAVFMLYLSIVIDIVVYDDDDDDDFIDP